MKIQILEVCFYCKHVIKRKSKTCPHCGSIKRTLKVRVIAKCISPWWKLWSRKYEYIVLDDKYKYLTKRLNEGSSNA